MEALDCVLRQGIIIWPHVHAVEWRDDEHYTHYWHSAGPKMEPIMDFPTFHDQQGRPAKWEGDPRPV